MSSIAIIAGHLDPRYLSGATKIWYMQPNFFRDGLMGYDFLREQHMLPDPRRLDQTHVLVGSINESTLGEVYLLMQGHEWSPGGEARSFIQSLGLDHTSMCVGDIIERGNDVVLVDRIGFRLLESGDSAW